MASSNSVTNSAFPNGVSLLHRSRRLRRTASLRRMVRETQLHVDELISDRLAPFHMIDGRIGAIRKALDALDEKKVIVETLISIKGAGADLILTHFAKEVSLMLH